MISNSGIHVKPYGRFLVFALIALVFVPGANYVADIFSIGSTEESLYWWDIFVEYYGHSILALAIFLIAILVGVKWNRLLGKPVTMAGLIPGMRFICFSILLSVTAGYIFLLLLAFVDNEFAQSLLHEELNSLSSDNSGYHFLPNVLSFLSLVIITPILEEVVFRGFLLHRWSYKWNLRAGIIVSSLLFAVLHSEMIGAFVFGVGMCILYLKTQSLLVPILCHAANNLVPWIMETIDQFIAEPEQEFTIEALQSTWYVGLILAVIVIIWTILYFRNRKPQAYELPVA